MAIQWEAAPQDVVELAEELVEKHHPKLRNANIGILFREKATMSKGQRTLGKASKVTGRWKPLLDDNYHFIIWLAADWWRDEATPAQQRALLDHELQHCYMFEGWEPKMRGHDIEEFACIIERHGLWRENDAERRVAAAMKQQELPFVQPTGRISALDPEKAAGLPA